MRGQNSVRSARGQFSLELMIAFAAYAALIASFVGALNYLSAEGKARAAELVEKTELEAVCSVLDSFAVNARNTAMKLEVDSSRYVVENGSIKFEKRFSKTNASVSVKCFSRMGGRGVLEVEESSRESA